MPIKGKKGRLEVICGSMFSGKSEELIRRLHRAEFAKQNVITFKPGIDTRKSLAHIVSHNGKERRAYPISNSHESLQYILELADDSIDVVGIDEVQFLPTEIITVIMELIDHGKQVIVAGLDLDFRSEPFGVIPTLLALADEIVKLKAICVICAQEAQHSQRLINGKPASYDDPIILIGAEELYEARCRDCFVTNKPREKQNELFATSPKTDFKQTVL
jgi:thymidine kinase